MGCKMVLRQATTLVRVVDLMQGSTKRILTEVTPITNSEWRRSAVWMLQTTQARKSPSVGTGSKCKRCGERSRRRIRDSTTISILVGQGQCTSAVNYRAERMRPPFLQPL